MERNWLQELLRVLIAKYRMHSNRKEIRTSIVITIFIYYILKNKEKYELELNPIIAKEVIPSLIRAEKIEYIVYEILIPMEKKLKLKNYISNTFNNSKINKDTKIMYEIFENISNIEKIEVHEIIDFINLELEANEVKEERSINRLIKKIIQNRSNENVLDNFAGIGETIVTAIEDKEKEIQIQEIDEEQCAIATILLVMLEYKNFDIINIDTLTYYDNKKFDLILSIPPLVMDTTQINIHNYNTKISECNKRDSWGSIATSYNKMSESGQLITLVSTGAITSIKKVDINARRFLIERENIRAIIEFPPRILYGSNVKTSLLVIDQIQSSEITLINLDSTEGKKYQRRLELGVIGITEEGIDEIYEIIYNNKKSEISRRIKKEEILENCELLPSLYIHKEEKYEKLNMDKLLKEKQELVRKAEELEEESRKIIKEYKGGELDG